MIIVKITDHSIWMSGYACRKSLDGIDRACAAVSALTCNLINSLRDLTEDHILTLESSGKAIIEWEQLSEKGKLLVDSWFLSLTDINREYNCITFL